MFIFRTDIRAMTAKSRAVTLVRHQTAVQNNVPEGSVDCMQIRTHQSVVPAEHLLSV